MTLWWNVLSLRRGDEREGKKNEVVIEYNIAIIYMNEDEVAMCVDLPRRMAWGCMIGQ